MGFRSIQTIIGALVAALGLSMLLPAIADGVAGHEDWRVFAGASLVTTLSGAGLWASSAGKIETLTLRQAFLLTALIWVVLTLFGSLPLYWSDLNLSFTDALFEAMSGITTTGATVITTLDTAPPGILLWRGLLQWFGGLGIVVMAIAVLPMLQVGGMQMFRAEAFETPDKILPRAAQIAGGMTLIYGVLTILAAAAYWFFGMGLFDAIVHAMTTVATGGFSTRNGSIESYESIAIDYTSVTFMILGALPFALYLGAVQYGHWKRLFADSQIRTFFLLLVAVTTGMMIVQVQGNIYQGEEAFRHALFSVTSVMTGTGYATVDYGAWGPWATSVFFFLTFVGGCTGSTSCGIKIFRFQVLARDLYQHVRQILMPSLVYVKRYNGAPLPESVSISVQSFVFLYIVSFFVLALALTATGMDPVTALSGAATAISNVGPGLGDIIGPAGNFASLSDVAKWLLTAGMLVGRLEILIILVMFTPRFWRG
ncbi:MAG TPA: TrkH family potassium uptake protein [Devosia sp.]|nr:TrkH family potassium uptake protein [Devosia sp.]